MDYFHAFFFDFDGVLVDSVEIKRRAFALLFQKYGNEVVSRVIEHYRRFGGITRFERLVHYHSEFVGKTLDSQELDSLCQIFSKLVVDEIVTAPAIDGSVAFLKKHCSQIPCFVVSATPEEEMREIIQRRGLGKFFREILGAPLSKDKNLKTILNKYSFQPERCFFFGDAESDYAAAKACGVPFVGIVSGTNAELLNAVPGVEWVKDFTEVEGFLIDIRRRRTIK